MNYINLNELNKLIDELKKLKENVTNLRERMNLFMKYERVSFIEFDGDSHIYPSDLDEEFENELSSDIIKIVSLYYKRQYDSMMKSYDEKFERLIALSDEIKGINLEDEIVRLKI